ncbi:hypothetical protein M0P65_02420 [Candidatus Gracilibacteria bacterium]|nr:hypothetical protein [Candidatus Gracilibacteria bacterium]
MNKPALKSFDGEKIDHNANVGNNKIDELKSRFVKMQERKTRFDIIKEDKKISEWINFSIDEYEDIIYASLMEDLGIDYSEEVDDEKTKLLISSQIFAQKQSILLEIKNLIKELEKAKDDFRVNAKSTFNLLNQTINNAEMIFVTLNKNHKLKISDLNECFFHYDELETHIKSIFNSYSVIEKIYTALNKTSLDTIVNLYIIKLFKDKKFNVDSYKEFCKSEKVRALLQDKSGENKEFIFNEQRLLLSQLENQRNDIEIALDNLEISTNIIIGQILKTHYINTIFEEIEKISEVLGKLEISFFDQKVMLNKINKDIEEIDFSGNLSDIFSKIQKISDNYKSNILTLQRKYSDLEKIKNISNIIEKLKTLYFKIKVELIPKIVKEYQDTRKIESHLKPETSVKDVLNTVNPGNMGLLKMLYYFLLKIFDKKVFDEEMITEALKKYDKISPDKGQKRAGSIRGSIEKLLIDNVNDMFYEENLNILEEAVILYIKRVEDYIGNFALRSEHSDIKNISDLQKNINNNIESDKGKN